MKARKRGPVGVKWKVLSYLSLFIAVLLILLWLFQTVFLGSFYRMVKTRAIRSAADTIVRQLGSDSLDELVTAIADQDDVCVRALDASYEEIASAEASKGCVIHSADVYDIYSMVKTAEEKGGSATILRDDVFPLRRPGFLQNGGQGLAPGGGESRIPAGDGQELPEMDKTRARPQSIVYIRLVDGENGRTVLLLDALITPVDATVSTLRIQLICITILLALLAVGLAFLISRRISRPIIRLNDAAGELAAGNYEVSIPEGGYREIDELGDTLRYAAGELSTVERLRRELIANVSHDLRTPLTMIIGYSEAMRDIPGENTPENVQIIIEEAERLTGLVGDMLDLSRLQSGAASLSPSVYNLTASLSEVTERLAKLTAKDGYVIRFEADRAVRVLADETRISQVLYNLIGNALNHAGEDRQVLVKQSAEDGPDGKKYVRIEVCDHGKGIPAGELPHIFDRYYKLDGTRTRPGPDGSPIAGTGLGLSIVRSVLELHGAAYGVDSTEGAGSRFWFRLPVQETDTDG